MDKYFFKLKCDNFTDKKWEAHTQRAKKLGGLYALEKQIEHLKKFKKQ